MSTIRKSTAKAPKVFLALMLSLMMIGLFTLAGCGGASSLDGDYSVTKESVFLGGGGSSDSYDEDTNGMSVTIAGLEESEGQTGTITLNKSGDIYTGTLTNDKDEDDERDFHYKVTWDDENAPEETSNPYGYSAGSVNTESTYLSESDGEIRLMIIWNYSHILYYSDSSDIYQGIDTYTLEKQ